MVLRNHRAARLQPRTVQVFLVLLSIPERLRFGENLVEIANYSTLQVSPRSPNKRSPEIFGTVLSGHHDLSQVGGGDRYGLKPRQTQLVFPIDCIGK
jgi:hypothetical protein